MKRSASNFMALKAEPASLRSKLCWCARTISKRGVRRRLEIKSARSVGPNDVFVHNSQHMPANIC